MASEGTAKFEATYEGRPGDNRDLAAHSIVGMYGGKVTGAGTFLPTGTRDLQIEVAMIYARPLKEALRKAGLHVDGD